MFTLTRKKSLVVPMIAMLTVIMVLSPMLDTGEAFAKDKKKKNKGNQEIDQEQSSRQNSQCVSGEDLSSSCNNLSFQDQDNEGNNAAAQDGGDGKKKKNKGNQEIDQEQSSRQNSQCVAGGSIDSSCNNLSFQDQDNEGNNAAAQDGGDGKKKKNKGNQEIDQEQENEQNAQCVSGEDAIVSCNNIQFQNQVNSGNNALGQN